MNNRTESDRRAPLADTAGPSLSVVVVTYNEADRIETCLESVFEACRALADVEVVLVDSRSDDATVELAHRYPVGIYRLPEAATCTAGAGRYVGTRLTKSDRILFVDGDSAVDPSWLDAALTRLADDATVAGVDGYLNDCPVDEEHAVDALRGVVLYDRTALTSAGGFDPFMASLEDIELGFRLTQSGYRLIRLPAVAATHPFNDGVAELRRRWASGYYFGRGQVLRKHLTSPAIFCRTLYYSRLFGALGVWTLLGLLATATVGIVGALVWIGTTALLAGSLIRYNDSWWVLRKTISFLPVYIGALYGFIGSHPDSSAYPIEAVEHVREPPQRAELLTGGTR